MNRLFFTVFFVFSFLINGFLIARVNPFAPTQSSEDIPISNNYTQAPGNFKTVSFKLPKTSRIINYVEISYKNIDGSTEKLKVDIDKKFDWNKKLVLSYGLSCPKCKNKCKLIRTKTIRKIIKKRVSKIVNNKVVYDKTTENNISDFNSSLKDEVTVTHYMNKEAEKKAKELASAQEALSSINGNQSSFNNKVDVEQAKKEILAKHGSPIYSGSSTWNNKSTNITQQLVKVSLGNPRFSLFEFDIKNSIIKISSTDKKNRHFMLVRPARIVIDFLREFNFPNQTFPINQGIFKEMKVARKGDKVYRVTIYIKEGYRYKFTKTEMGYNVKCFKR